MNLLDINKDELQNLSDNSYSFCDMLRKLGYKSIKGNIVTLKRKIDIHSIDLTKLNINRNIFRKSKGNKQFFKNKKALCDILVENSNYSNMSWLKDRLVNENILPYKCVECGNSGIWNDKKISLHIDHINGVNNDNRIENLRFLCPNCHSQTKTYCGKNKSTYKSKILNCSICGDALYLRNTCGRCRKCNNNYNSQNQTKKFTVSKDDLETLLHEMPLTKIGEKYNVSAQSIVKRCKRLNIIIPKFPYGHWSNRK